MGRYLCLPIPERDIESQVLTSSFPIAIGGSLSRECCGRSMMEIYRNPHSSQGTKYLIRHNGKRIFELVMSLVCYTEAVESSHMNGGDNSSQGFPLSSYCSVSFHSPLVRVLEPHTTFSQEKFLLSGKRSNSGEMWTQQSNGTALRNYSIATFDVYSTRQRSPPSCCTYLLQERSFRMSIIFANPQITLH